MPNIHKLKNGMTLITDYVNTVETVSVGMWNKVGARNERKEINGVAHLLAVSYTHLTLPTKVRV